MMVCLLHASPGQADSHALPQLSSHPGPTHLGSWIHAHTHTHTHTHTHRVLQPVWGSRYQEERPMCIQKKADGPVALEFSFIFESINVGATK